MNNLSKQIDNRCASLEIEMAEQISKELIDFMQKMYSSLKKLSNQIDKQSMDTIQLHKDIDSLKKQVENIKEDMLKCSKLNKFSENILLQPVQPEGLKIVTKTEKLSNLPPQQSLSDPDFNQTDYVKQLKRQMYAGSIANSIPKNLCYGCMKVNNGEAICPYCGFDKNYKQATPYLPLGTKLKNGNYIIGKKVSSNAEGAKYISYSKDIQIPVIIEEFMPIVMIGRARSQTCIWVKQGFEKKYKTLQREFIYYYYTLPEILNVFNENNTSYVVTKIYDSVSLREYLNEHGNLDWNAAKSLFMPLISDIKFLHKKKIGHYAISPDNVIITNNGKIKLSNFAIEEMRKAGGFLDSELIDGFAAPEQYEKFTDLDESTDVYGLSATLLYALAGITLKNANERHANENINFPQWLLEKIPSNVIMAISKGLALKKSDRIQTFGELCTYFDAYKTTSFKYLMYRVGGNEICLIEYIDNRSEVVIPSEIDNKFVKGLVGTFQNCKNLKSVMIPDSINFIGEKTFYGCRILRDVYIPNSVVSIADDAFGSCDIRLTIHGEKDSYAEKYAKEKHFKFIETD